MTGGRGGEGENDVVAAEDEARRDACCSISSSSAASASSCSLRLSVKGKAGALARSTLPRSIGLMELSRLFEVFAVVLGASRVSV